MTDIAVFMLPTVTCGGYHIVHCCSGLSEVWVDMQCMAVNCLSPESDSCSDLQKARTVGITLHAQCTVHWYIKQ